MGLTRWSQPVTRSVSAMAMPFFPHAEAPDFVQGDVRVATTPIPGGQVSLAFVPFPIPAAELALPIQVAWQWPAAREVVPQHRSHVICHATSTTLDPVALHLHLSNIVAALLKSGGGSGVYVGTAGLVREAAGYVRDMEMARPDSLPLFSWIGFIPVGEGKLTDAYTSGLTGFGFLELEVRDTKLEWGELSRLLANVAHFQITNGVQIRDGDTLGATQADRKLVRHLDSSYFPGTKSAVIAA